MSLTFDWDGDINVTGKLKQNGQDINEEISSVKNDVAVNRTTLGYQCKNLFNKDGEINYIYTGDRPAHQKWYSTVSGNVITVRAPLTLTNIAGQFISKAKGKKIILSGKLLSINSSNSADMLAIRAYTRNVPAPIFETRTNNIGEFSCKIDCEEYDEVFVCFGLWYGDGTAEIENIMIRYADITDDTYESYVPSVAEQLGNKLGKTETAAAAVLDGAGNNIAEQFAEIYGLETANTTDIEQNKSDISNAENAIAINRSTLGTQRVNIFDGELKAGDIHAETGTDLGSDLTVITKNYIAVTPNAIISISRTENSGYMSWRFYDENKNYLGIADDSNIKLLHGGNVSNVLTQQINFGCFKLINPKIKYMRFRDHTNSLSNVYTIVEGEYTEDTMPVYEPYKPSVNERLVEVENDVANINTTLSNIMLSTDITITPGGVQKYVRIGMTSTAVTEYLIIMQTTTGIGYATYLFRGYGEGGTVRCRITQLNGGASPSIFINGGVLYIKLFDTSNNHYISVYNLQGNMPTLAVAENYTGDPLTNTLPAELEARLKALESALNTTGGDE